MFTSESDEKSKKEPKTFRYVFAIFFEISEFEGMVGMLFSIRLSVSSISIGDLFRLIERASESVSLFWVWNNRVGLDVGHLKKGVC